MSNEVINVLKNYLGNDIINSIDYSEINKDITAYIYGSKPYFEETQIDMVYSPTDSLECIKSIYRYGNFKIVINIVMPYEKMTVNGFRNIDNWNKTYFTIQYGNASIRDWKETSQIRISKSMYTKIREFSVQNSNVVKLVDDFSKRLKKKDNSIEKQFYKYVSDCHNEINKTIKKNKISRDVTLSFTYNDKQFFYKKGQDVFDGIHGLLVVKSGDNETEYKDNKCEMYARAINSRKNHEDELRKWGKYQFKKDNNIQKIKAADFLVRSNYYGCVEKEHSLKDINAIVRVAGSKEVYEISVPASYCEECKKYYILEEYYRELKSYGYIWCRGVEISDLKNNSKTLDFNGFKDQSLLNSYGYNVSKTKGLSKELRQYILQNIVNNGIMKKEEVISFINKLIQINKNKDNFKSAINKWQEDVKYVSSLQNNPKNVNVKKIIIKTKS